MSEVEIHGLTEVLAELKRIEPRLAKNSLRGAVRKVAAEIRDDARARVPVDTGNLRRNIVSQARRGKRNIIRSSVTVREERGDRVMSRSEWRRERFKKVREAIKNAFYWRFVEYGTRWMPARPFLRPALDSMKNRVGAVMQTYLRSRIDKDLKG